MLVVKTMSSKPTIVPATGTALLQLEVKSIESIFDQPAGVLAAGKLGNIIDISFSTK